MLGSILSFFLIVMTRDISSLHSKVNNGISVVYHKTKYAAFPFRTRNISQTDYPHEFSPEASVYDITRLHHQMQLLKYLENPHIGDVDKLDEIEEMSDLLNNNSKYLTNLFAGGLLRDW